MVRLVTQSQSAVEALEWDHPAAAALLADPVSVVSGDALALPPSPYAFGQVSPYILPIPIPQHVPAYRLGYRDVFGRTNATLPEGIGGRWGNITLRPDGRTIFATNISGAPWLHGTFLLGPSARIYYPNTLAVALLLAPVLCNATAPIDPPTTSLYNPGKSGIPLPPPPANLPLCHTDVGSGMTALYVEGSFVTVRDGPAGPVLLNIVLPGHPGDPL